MRQTVHRVLTQGGNSVAVHDFGGPKHTPLLLLPANGFHGMCYEAMARLLREKFWCLALDFPHQGDSGPAPAHDNICEHFAAAVLAVTSFFRLKDTLVFGHSIGGLIALLLEVRHPGTFSAIFCWEAVVRDPSIRWYDSDGSGDLSIAALTRKRKRRFASREAAMCSYAGKVPFCYFRADALRAYVEYGFKPCEGGQVELCCPPEAEARCFNSVDPMCGELWEGASRVACPVVSASGHDLSPQNFFSGPERAAEPLAQRLGNAIYEQHEHLTHLGPLQQPGVVAERCLEHFGRVQAARQHKGQPMAKL